MHRFQGTVRRDVPLSAYTRFGIGGPADFFIEADTPDAFVEALRDARLHGLRTAVIGGGTNLVVSDEGFRGAVLKYAGDRIHAEGTRVTAEGGASLQALVDYAIVHGLRGLETMTGIPGSAGAAIYGNAGAYGHSISERISGVRFFDGREFRTLDNAECDFRYRESIFKREREWIVFAADLEMEKAPAAELEETASKILAIRNKKYPPSMKCAGSIFKNFLLAELPGNVRQQLPPAAIIEGKVPSAWFLEQVGAKGMRRGDIQVADYHANLIYNDGHGTARDLVSLIRELKARVRGRWDIPLEEEVQFIGFN